ncbi:MAG: hypothetical protein ACM3QX_18220 [Syntrophomonadaceae bacterium]
MATRQNPMNGIITGLLGGALNFYAAKQKRDKEEETYKKRLQYQADLDKQKSDRDMQDWAQKNSYEDNKKQAAFDAFDQITGYKTVPEVQTNTTIGVPQPNGTLPITQQVTGLGRRTDSFEGLTAEAYYRNLAILKRQDALAGTKMAEDYIAMGKKRGFEESMPAPEYSTNVNEQTGTVTYIDKNNPYSRPKTVNAPGVQKVNYQYNQDSNNPWITRINTYTGQIEKVAKNPAYRPPVSFGISNGYRYTYNYQTGAFSIKEVPELRNQELEKAMKTDANYKALETTFRNNMADIQTYETAKRMGQEDVYDYTGKKYNIDEFALMVKNQRAALSEIVKSQLGANRSLFDNNWNEWQEHKIDEYEFQQNLIQGMADGLRQGTMTQKDVDLNTKLFYLTWGMFPSELKKQELSNGR